MPTVQISWGMTMVPIRVLNWVSEDIGKGFPSKSFRVSIASAWDSVSTMNRRYVMSCIEGYPSHLVFGAFLKLESVY